MESPLHAGHGARCGHQAEEAAVPDLCLDIRRIFTDRSLFHVGARSPGPLLTRAHSPHLARALT